MDSKGDRKRSQSSEEAEEDRFPKKPRLQEEEGASSETGEDQSPKKLRLQEEEGASSALEDANVDAPREDRLAMDERSSGDEETPSALEDANVDAPREDRLAMDERSSGDEETPSALEGANVDAPREDRLAMDERSVGYEETPSALEDAELDDNLDQDEAPTSYCTVSSSEGEPIVVEKTDQDDVNSFHLAYKNFKQTNNHSDIFKCTESDTGFIDDYTDFNDDNNNDNSIGITFFDGEIQELKALLNSLTQSVPTPKNLDGRATCPKSDLKRKLTSPKLDTCDTIKRLHFTYIKVFYFERSQGFCSVPSKGGLTLGMMKHHFFSTIVPIEEYEREKIQRVIPPPRSDDLRMSTRIEKPKNIKALTCWQRAELLEGCGIEINEEEVMDCSIIRLLRLACGCDCKGFCDPDVCSCSLSGVQCQVDRPNFPCGCVRKNCHNSMGRNEFNPNKVKIHFTKTIKRVSTEIKRVSNRLVGMTSANDDPVASKT